VNFFRLQLEHSRPALACVTFRGIPDLFRKPSNVGLARYERDVFGESTFGGDLLPHTIQYHGVVIDAASQFVKPQAVVAEVTLPRGKFIAYISPTVVMPAFAMRASVTLSAPGMRLPGGVRRNSRTS